MLGYINFINKRCVVLMGIKWSRVVWIVCLFLELIVILLMVMDYKINYQYSNMSKKLYFYECDNDLCTTEVSDRSKKLYSTYDCWYNTCPVYKGIINDDYALLKEENGLVLFNYKTGNVVTSGYDSYTFINQEYIIVEKTERYGIIDYNDNVVVKTIYDQLGYSDGDVLKGYNTNNIIAKKNLKYGIISFKDGSIVEKFVYDDNNISKLKEIINKG